MAHDIKKLTEWLQNNGAEVLPPTNQYEVLRFKGQEVGVIYSTGNTSGRYVQKMLEAFYGGKPWDGRPISTGRNGSYKKQKAAILKRDGSACFYCSELLGEDITLEHLIPLTAGGPNILSNMVLAHEECNRNAGAKPIFEKVSIAVKARVEKYTKDDK